MTETALSELLSANLSGPDLVAIMIDGVHLADTCYVVALGIDSDGTKHPFGGGRRRHGERHHGHRTARRVARTRPGRRSSVLVGIDGSSALCKAVGEVFDHPIVQRCQLHKICNVKDLLPQKLRTTMGRKRTQAYHADSVMEAETMLENLVTDLERTHPGAAARLREGLPETLTVLRLGVPPTLARTLRSTNAIESMISVCRDHSHNVKRWRDAQMALRWCAVGMIKSGKKFRRVNGHLHLPALRAALDREVAVVHNDRVKAA